MLGGCPLDSPAVAYLLHLGNDKSRQTALYALRRVSACFGTPLHEIDWPGITHAQLLGLRAWLGDRYEPSTANLTLTCVRGVLLKCCKLELLSYEAFQRVLVKVLPGSRMKAGRSLEPKEVGACFDSCQARGIAGARTAAVLALCYGGGLRRSEACSIQLPTDMEVIDDVLTVRIVGKGNRERAVPLPDGARAAVEGWLEFRGRAPGPLLCNFAGRGHSMRADVSSPMVGGTIYQLIKRLVREAKLGKSFSPHDLRRTYIGDLLDAGVDLATTSALVGHADPATTSGYDRRPARVRVAAAGKIKVPFGRIE